MAKKITAAAVSSAAKKVYELKTYHLTDINGEIWDIAIDEKMAPVKAADAAKNIMTMTINLIDEGIEKTKLLDNYQIMLYGEILNQFTDTSITKKKTAIETYENYIKMFDGLINLNLLEQIIEKFDKEALQRTTKTIAQIINDFNDFTDKNLENVIANNEVTSDRIDEDVADLVIEDDVVEDEVDE